MYAPKKAYERLVSGLGEDIRELLARGADYWSSQGPGDLEDELLQLMQFDDTKLAGRHLTDLSHRLTEGGPASVLDLTRALWLTELGVISTVVGPRDWENMYATSSDLDAFMSSEVVLLRRAQEELARYGVPASGTDPFGKHPRSVRSVTSRLLHPPPHNCDSA